MTKKGYKQTKEHREKVSLSRKGKHNSPKTEFKKGCKKPKNSYKFPFGNKNPAKKKINREKMSILKTGRKLSEETKRKIGLESIKQSKNNPNFGMRGKHHTKETIKKIFEKRMKNGGYPKGKEHQMYGKKHKEESIIKIKEARKKQITPKKDTTIEVIIQNYLKQLKIEFLTHQYMKEIEHGYQCDILIPVQNGITKKTIIECFGTYWHKYPLSREIDIQRCNELREKGWRVLVFWENEIRVMELEDLKMEVIKK